MARTIVLADDNEELRDSLSEILQEAGFAVVQLEDGLDLDDYLGLSMDHPPAHLPDLVITDIRMPGLSGLEVLKMIRSSHPELKVLLISGFANSEIHDEAKGLQSVVLEKPLKIERFLQVVNDFFIQSG